MTQPEIKLPPVPEGMCLREDIEDYARAAVEEDRAARKPLTQRVINYGFAAQEGGAPFQNGVRFAERHHGIMED